MSILTKTRPASGTWTCKNSLDDFLFFGGYPGAAPLIRDESRWARYIGSSIVEPTISQDILLMEEVRKPALLRTLFVLGANYSAQELSFTKVMGRGREYRDPGALP